MHDFDEDKQNKATQDLKRKERRRFGFPIG